MLSAYHLARRIIFIVVRVFAAIVLGLCANFVAYFGGIPVPDLNFTGYGIAVSLITVLLVTAVSLIDRFRKGAFTSLLVVEVAWSGVLWVMWLAMGAAAAVNDPNPSVCTTELLTPQAVVLCKSWSAITAFSFLNWIILMGWFITLLVFGFRGNHWTSHISDTQIHLPRAGATASTSAPMATNGDKPASAYPSQAPAIHTGNGYNPYQNSVPHSNAHPVQHGPTPGAITV